MIVTLVLATNTLHIELDAPLPNRG